MHRPPSPPATGSAWADTVVSALTVSFTAARDPDRAAPMRAYLRDQFPFFGIPAQQVKTAARRATTGLPTPTEADLRAVALACWDRPEREYQYAACQLLIRHARICSAAFIDTAHTLITTKSWWDTVDLLAAHLVGTLVDRHPELTATMDAWITDDNLWLARTALLHQLRYGDRTDARRLFDYCTARAADQDFFIRKAIGWALRQYSRTAPTAVRAYLDTHSAALSPLSLREASRHLT